MSARNLDQAPDRCACGALPAINKMADAFGRQRHGFYLHCTRCGVQTEVTESLAEAVADWNDSKVNLPPDDFVAARREPGVSLFNPVLR